MIGTELSGQWPLLWEREMGLLVFIIKTAETEETVTYGYGGGPDDLVGVVSLHKATCTPEDEDALPREARIALRAIFRGKSKTGDWPHYYTYAA
ncbi:hypothetical protein ACTWPT_32490 [Nonomuraea sp. 3N208]|uniref:hypothetical protein n=1 Tax=Nonomuraea sp. 3N208 TaxID=3457421 RepID=UPI003FD3A625